MRGWGRPSHWWSPGDSHAHIPQVCSSSLPSNTPTPNWATRPHHQALGQHPGNTYANPAWLGSQLPPMPRQSLSGSRASLQNSRLLLCAKIQGSFPSHLRKSTTRPGPPALPSGRPGPASHSPASGLPNLLLLSLCGSLPISRMSSQLSEGSPPPSTPWAAVL